MSKFQNLLRSAVLAAIVIGAAFLCGLRLLEIQIADGSKYLAMTQSTHTATQDIEAARGKIADSTGKILNTNELNCSVKLQAASPSIRTPESFQWPKRRMRLAYSSPMLMPPV